MYLFKVCALRESSLVQKEVLFLSHVSYNVLNEAWVPIIKVR